jgi:quercetin dioxygenase-like cupin family protein
MMKLRHLILLVALAFGAMSTGLLRADELQMVRVKPEDVKWSEYRGGSGVQMAVVSGDPSRKGVYVIRVKFAPQAMSKPHFHPEDRYVTVLKGTWWTGTGDKFDPDTTVPLPAGSLGIHPAGLHHFDGAKDEEVIVQITGVGPSGITYIHPEDDPKNKQ